MSQNPDHKIRARGAIDFDPIGFAKEIAGEDSEDFPALALYAVRRAYEEKKTSLSELCDTYYRMPWAEFLEILAETGFVELIRYTEDTGYSAEEFVIAAHPERKLLASAHSSTHEHLGAVLDYTFYLSAAADDQFNEQKRLAIYKAGGDINPVGESQYLLGYHVTDGLKLKLEEFDELGIEFIDWPAEERYSRESISLLPDLPQWVKDFTGVM